mgnify:CR=1 FL=1
MSTFAIGEKVFFEHAEESWILGKVKDVLPGPKAGEKHYTCEGAALVKAGPPSTSAGPLISTTGLPESKLHHIVGGHPDEDPTCDDLLDLSYLHASTLVHSIRRRYFDNVIYTRIGPIIVALNPYDYTLPNYVDARMPQYIAEGDRVIASKSTLLPHAWSTAHYAYWQNRTFSKNQSILVSGESGAGKTETAKIVVRYLGIVSTSRCSATERNDAEEVTKKVNGTSPILEAFGNAKTARNDNSSRFGKFMKVQFDTRGVMVGALIEVYLLEKSRIVTHAHQERSYHSFYQLLKGSTQGTKTRMQLDDASRYRNLNVGDAVNIAGVDDAEDYSEVARSMDIVGLTPPEQQAVWEVVGGVLHAQLIDFVENANGESSVSATTFSHATQTAMLWNVNATELVKEYCTTTSNANNETWTKALRRDQAADVRDALSKALYEKLFLNLVHRINALISVSEDRSANWIGLLDIFGFESFPINSFEQLCINLANETLQGHYNHTIFTRDMEECKEEGIDTQSVVFYDNNMCLELLSGKMSIMSLLDDESALSKGSDQSFFEKVRDTFAAHPNFVVPRLQKTSAFIVKHYAGDISYTVTNFREKNNDSLKDAMKLLLRRSGTSFIAGLLPEPEDRRGKALTVGGLFRQQLKNLMATINSTNPHWIRCVKPHSAKKPRMFRGCEVMNQLCYAGVLETIRIRKMSFCVRFPFDEFWRHFKNILKRKLPAGGEKQAAADIIKAAKLGRESGQVGKTKIFLKTEGFHAVSKLNQAVLEHITMDVLRAAKAKYSASIVTHRRRLKSYIARIQAFARGQQGEKAMRGLELRAREKYLLVSFRGIIMLQTQEDKVRSALDAEMGESFQLVVTLRRIDMEKKQAEWRIQQLSKQKKDREQCLADAAAALGALFDESLSTAHNIVQFFGIGGDEERSRDVIDAEFNREQQSLVDAITNDRAAVQRDLAERARQRFLTDVALLSRLESMRRSEISHEEFVEFTGQGALIKLQEAVFLTFQHNIADAELKDRQRIFSLRAKEVGELEERWWEKKQAKDRVDMRNCQSAEHRLRVDILKVEQQDVIALLTAMERSFEDAGTREWKRLRQDEARSQREMQRQRERHEKAQVEHFEQQRRMAKLVWRKALAEKQSVEELQRQSAEVLAEETLKTIALTTTLRSFQEKEISHRQQRSTFMDASLPLAAFSAAAMASPTPRTPRLRSTDPKTTSSAAHLGGEAESPARSRSPNGHPCRPCVITSSAAFSPRSPTGLSSPRAGASPAPGAARVPQYMRPIGALSTTRSHSRGSSSAPVATFASQRRRDAASIHKSHANEPCGSSSVGLLKRLQTLKRANPATLQRPPMDPHEDGWVPPATDATYLPDGSVVRLPTMRHALDLEGEETAAAMLNSDLL